MNLSIEERLAIYRIAKQGWSKPVSEAIMTNTNLDLSLYFLGKCGLFLTKLHSFQYIFPELAEAAGVNLVGKDIAEFDGNDERGRIARVEFLDKAIQETERKMDLLNSTGIS